MHRKNLAPVVLFVYNRPKHTNLVLQSLMENELAASTTLYIYADGPKKNATAKQLADITETRQVIRKQKWCGTVKIIERDENKGLATSIIGGVTEVVNTYGTVIVLEDDIVPAKGFLKFMNASLNRYKNEEHVFQVSGFSFPEKTLQDPAGCFFMPLISSWGWATWQRAWAKFDLQANGYERLKSNRALRHRFDLSSSYPYADMLVSQMEHRNVDSWAIRWYWTLFINNKLSLFPERSYVSNIGYGEDATHTKTKLKFVAEVPLNTGDKETQFPALIETDKKKWTSIKKFIASNYALKSSFPFRQKFVSVYHKIFSVVNSKQLQS